MFPLHDRTKRWICRAGFLLGGVLPMAAVIGWSSAIHTGVYKEAVRAELKASLGLEVRFDRVSYPRPGVTLLSNVDLLDPENEEVLLHARMLEIGGGERAQTVVVSQPEVNAAGLDRLWPLVQRWQRHGDANQAALRVSASELTVRWPLGVQTLVDCDAQIELEEANRVASATFRIAGADAETPARLGARWNTSAEGESITTFKLETGDTPLPCSLLAALVHRENWLGPNCVFQGSIRIEDCANGRQSEMTGQLEQVDLQSAVSDHFPHQLTGAATVTLEHAVLRDGRLEEATGAIHAGPGVVGRSLVRSAVESLKMRASGHSSDESMGYEELAAAFAWDAKGLTIRGKCETSEAGAILRMSGETVLMESSGGALPVASLVQALVPDSRVQVPATRQTDWLLRALPLPDVQAGDSESAPHARLRAGSDLH